MQTAAAVDTAALANALRSMGLCYGLGSPLGEILAGASDEASAVRNYVRRERAHLLTAYDLETLVAMVLAAREACAEPPASIEARLAA